jgi:hypothetical protein
MNKDKNILHEYIPQDCVEPIVEWLHRNRVQLRISRARNTKLGDFRAPQNGGHPRISVNHNLNIYAFLLTLVHEMAHVEVWKTKSIFRRIQPHGKEWQDAFVRLITPFLNNTVFPSELLPVLNNYFKKPKASSVSDQQLVKALKRYDLPSENPQLSDLEPGNQFLFRNSPFEVVKKQRSRYQCKSLQNNRLYLINGLAEVEKLEP